MTFKQICLCIAGLELLRERLTEEVRNETAIEVFAAGDAEDIDDLIDKLNDDVRCARDDEDEEDDE